MSDLFWLSRSQLRRIEPYFPRAHGVFRVLMISALFPGSFMSFATVFAGVMPQENMGRIRRSITALSAGAGWVSLIAYSLRLQPRTAGLNG